jgi:Kef-type K+ transport system membrane component KefB
MSPFIQLAATLIIILFAAKAAGLIAQKLGQPSVLGELLVGIILGPTLLDITHLPFATDTHLTEIIIELGEMGVLFIMFLAGMELHMKEMAGHFKVSAFSGILGVIFPVLLGWGTGLLFNMENSAALFLGLTMGATSVSISVQTLMELKVLRSKVGLGLLGAAVFDDILVIIMLSIFLALISGGNGLIEVLIIFGKILLFLGLSMTVGLWLLPKLAHWVARLPVSQGLLTMAITIMLIYGIGAEIIGGMAAITGTFIAGLMFSRSPEKSRFEPGLMAIAYGFFVPIFFISIGISVNLREVHVNALWLLLAISLVGILGKWVGSGLGAKIAGFSWLESIQLGAGMISRGEVGLIVGAVGLAEGLVTNNEFSAIIGMVLITTIITPPLLKSLFPNTPVQKQKTLIDN